MNLKDLCKTANGTEIHFKDQRTKGVKRCLLLADPEKGWTLKPIIIPAYMQKWPPERQYMLCMHRKASDLSEHDNEIVFENTLKYLLKAKVATETGIMTAAEIPGLEIGDDVCALS